MSLSWGRRAKGVRPPQLGGTALPPNPPALSQTQEGSHSSARPAETLLLLRTSKTCWFLKSHPLRGGGQPLATKHHPFASGSVPPGLPLVPQGCSSPAQELRGEHCGARQQTGSWAERTRLMIFPPQASQHSPCGASCGMM